MKWNRLGLVFFLCLFKRSENLVCISSTLNVYFKPGQHSVKKKVFCEMLNALKHGGFVYSYHSNTAGYSPVLDYSYI